MNWINLADARDTWRASVKTVMNIYIIIIIISFVLDKAWIPLFRLCVKIVIIIAFSHLTEQRRTAVNLLEPTGYVMHQQV